MTLIRLFVTGRCEHRGLASALSRAFPAATIAVFPDVLDGLTTRRLQPDIPSGKAAERFQAAYAELTRRRNQADFVILVDDLEVANIGNAAAVVAFHVEAARGVAAEVGTHNAEARFRERCSFHLLAPMLEAYFYSDPASLRAACVAANTRVLREPGDVERFHTFDAQYLAADHSSAPCVHPKRYLCHLSAGAYRETTEGVAALHALDWALALGPPRESLFLRSLFEDIAAMLGVANPWPGDTHRATWGSPTSLRNA